MYTVLVVHGTEVVEFDTTEEVLETLYEVAELVGTLDEELLGT